jgi:TonB family protein
MRWFFAGLLLTIFSLALAAEGLLIPENNPKPIYPKLLHRAGVERRGQVSFVVKADGSVSAISIVQSDHPDLAEAVKDAITQWRFKPWTAEDGRPAEQPVVAPMLFRLGRDEPIHLNQWLKSVKCHVINGSFRTCLSTPGSTRTCFITPALTFRTRSTRVSWPMINVWQSSPG